MQTAHDRRLRSAEAGCSAAGSAPVRSGGFTRRCARVGTQLRAGRGLRTAGALLLAVALVASCTGDDGAEPTSTTRAADEVVEGGTLRLGLAGPVEPDPALANLGSPEDLMVLDLLHDGLTRLDRDGEPRAALAHEWTSDDARTSWVFTLDPDATFASGRAVTASDVVASLEHVARGGDASLAALRLETISGFRPFVDGTAEHLAGLTAPDERTVQIVLDQPLSLLPVLLASPPYGVVDVDALGTAGAPPGAGPDLSDLDVTGGWSIADADADTVRLERREGAPGHLDEIQLHTYDDAEPAYAAFDAGDVDWALVPSDRYRDAVEAHGSDHMAPFHAELFFGLRVTALSLANADLRKAIAAAIDRDAIVDAVYADRADALATVVPGGVPGHRSDRCPTCEHDPERARELLAAAYPAGQVPTVAIDFDESEAQTAMATLVAEDLAAVGIPTTLRPKPLTEYKQLVVSGAQELFSFGWIGVYASPDAYLAPLFGSAANDNLTGLASADVDAALSLARTTADEDLAFEQWAGVEATVLEAAVVIPIAQFRVQAVVSERTQALEHAVDGSVDWSAVWVTDGD